MRFELPAEPIVVELYPDHEDFAVRTAGMPGLGILGAAFGYRRCNGFAVGAGRR